MKPLVTIHEITNAVIPNRDVRDFRLVYTPGRSVADYLAEAGLEVSELQLFHSGNRCEKIDPASWMPRPGDHITVAPGCPGDGGGGGKDALRTVAMLAVMAVAIGTSSYLSSALVKAGWGKVWAGVVGGLAGAAVGLIGGFIVNSILPPAPVDNPLGNFGGDWGQSTTYGWEIGNQTQPGFSIPVVYGTHRTGGQVIAEYVTTDGDNQYLNVLLAVSEGQVSSVSDVWINNQPAANYQGVETETRTGTNDQTPIANFNDVYQDRPVDATVVHGTPVTRQTTGTAVEGLRVSLSFPYGLYWASSGDYNPKTVSITLEYRLVGAGSWTHWDTDDVKDNRATAIRKVFEKTGLAAGQYEVRVTRNTADDDDANERSVIYWSLLTEIVPDDLAYPNVALVGVKALATNQLSGGVPTITSLVVRGDLTVYEEDGTPHTVSSDNPAWACWDILNNSRYGAGIGHARLDYNTFAEWADFCDEPVPDGQGSTEKRCTFDCVFDSQMTAFEAAAKCCLAGRAALVTVGAKYAVIIDRATAPTNLYSVGSIIEDSLEITYLPLNERSSQIEIQFANAVKDYSRDTISVVDQDAEYTNASTLSLIGVTRQSQAVRLGKFHLYLNKYCQKTVQFEVAMDGLIDEIGDVVNVQHDVPEWGYGGRVVGASSTTITLDQEVTLVEGTSYQIMVRLNDGTLVTKNISVPAGTTTTDTLTVTTAFASTPHQYDVYAFGILSNVTDQFRIIAIQRAGGDLDRFQITGLEYNASVYNCDTETPVLEESPTALAPPQVSGLILGEALVREGDRLRAHLLASWTPPTNYNGAEVIVSLDGAAEVVYSVNRSTCSLSLPVYDGAGCAVTVIAKNDAGVPSPRANAPGGNYIILGKLAPPEDVTSLAAQPSLTGLTLTWDAVSDIDLKEYVIRHTPETSGASWQNSTERARTTGTNKTFHAALEGTYLVKALDTSGVFSANAASVVVELPATFVWQVNTSLYDQTWAWDDGTMLDVFENASGNLQPAGSGQWDDMSVLDDVSDVDMYGGPVSAGYYEFPEADLTADTDVRVTTDLRWAADDYGDVLSDWPDVNERDRWDAAITATIGAKMQVKCKPDGGSYSDWMDVWTRDFTARYFTFRAKLWSDDEAAWPTVSKAGYSIDQAA
jgi:predicted phage tail protein